MKKIIAENDVKELSDFGQFMIANQGYYFWDKKVKQNVDKWEIFVTFNKSELEDVYAGIQKRYERKKKN